MKVFEKLLHFQKVTLWLASFCFENDKTGTAGTINSETYIAMLSALMTDNIYPDAWFQQDGASAHTHTHIPKLDCL